MSNQNNTIVLNGKQYNAHTGELLDNAKPAKSQPKSVKTIDGFAKQDNSPEKSTRHATVRHRTASHSIQHHKAQRSHTLMRAVVKQPKIIPPTTAKQLPHVLSGPTTYDVHREARAKAITKSTLITKYGPLAVHKPSSTKHSTSRQHHTPKSEISAISGAVDEAVASEQYKLTSTLPQPIKRRRKGHKVMNAVAVMAVIVLIVGFVVVKNVPDISLRIASSRSGVVGVIPEYRPTGFVLSDSINYSPGQLMLDYHSDNNDRNFTVIQSKTSWNDNDLLANFITNNHNTYQTYRDHGRLIFIYGDSNATWIQNGVWYRIVGNAQLSSDQLLRIAASM